MTDQVSTADDNGGVPGRVTATGGVAGALQLSLLRGAARVCRSLPGEAGPRWTRRATVAIAGVFGARATARCTVFGDGILEVSPADRYWMPYLLAGLPYEPDVLQALRTLLRPDSIFIDCGANIGWWSLYASTVIRDPTRILAVEPAYRAFLTLDRNRRLNDERFDCENVAVSDADLDAVALGTAPNRPASSALVEPDAASGRFPATEVVRCRRLDTIIDERFGIGVDQIVLKLDVEGAEVRALRGAGRHLRHMAAIVYEDHGQDASCDVSRELIESGFAVFAPTPTTGMPRMESLAQIAALKRDPDRGYNFVAARPGSRAHAAVQQAVAAR